MRVYTNWSADDDRETMIRLIDIVGREHIFAPYHMDTPLPAAPGLLALVRPSGHRFAGLRSIVHPPWWDVLLIKQSKNVCRQAGRLLCDLQTKQLGPTMVMVHWMRDSSTDDRLLIERALVEAHDPELNREISDVETMPSVAACG